MQQAPKTKDRVSIRQLAMLYIITSFSAAVRFLPAFTAKVAKEANWVSPIAAIFPIGLLIYFLHMIISKSKDKSTFEIINELLGKYIGNFIIGIHFLWVIFLLAYYVRLNGERLVSTVYPNINMTFFIVLTFVVTSFVLRSGATAVARLGELITPILLILFVFVTVFLLPKIRADALLPVYFNDTLPIMKASAGTLSLFSFTIIILLFSNTITGKENIAKISTKAALVFLLMLILILVMTTGILGSSVAARASNPFLIIVKQISILDTIENMESLVIAMWILSDAMMVALLSTVILNIMKYFFKLSEPRNLINILFVFIYIFSLGLASNRFQIDHFSSSIIIYLNTFLGYGTPALLFIVGKIRKKI